MPIFEGQERIGKSECFHPGHRLIVGARAKQEGFWWVMCLDCPSKGTINEAGLNLWTYPKTDERQLPLTPQSETKEICA